MIVEKASLAHFDALFEQSPDPWGTHSRRAEHMKRACIARMVGAHCQGRMLELGCGNGSNSRTLAACGLRLIACDGAPAALERAGGVLSATRNVTLYRLALPGRFPPGPFDLIVIAELLYYLDDITLASVMSEIDRSLVSGGALILCHHHRQFGDALQRQDDLHARFLKRSRYRWIVRGRQRTGSWSAIRADRPRPVPN